VPTIDDRTIGSLSDWVAARVMADGTPGLSLAITDRDRILHTATFGLADIAAGLPVTPAHLFETGSIGKSFTAITLLQLADEGMIDLQAPVTDYLPWFSIQSAFEPIRLHHLLSHTAGITSALDFAPAGAFQVWSLRDSVATTPPGTYFHYSNIGYKVLGEVLQAVTGETYGPTIQRRILDPLGLVNSIPTITHADRARLAVGYGPLYDDRPWWPGRPIASATWLETDTADGCLAMTAADLATYLRMLLNRGEHPGGRLLSSNGFDLLTHRAIQSVVEPEPAWYGYGITTRVVDGHTYLGHNGGMVGYFSSMIGDFDAGLGVTVVVNGPGSPGAIARAALDYLRAATEGRSFSLPQTSDPCAVDEAEAYAGDYVAVNSDILEDRPGTIAIRASGGRVTLVLDDGAVGLRPYGEDTFVTDAPAFDRLPMTFHREDGEVVGLMHGDSYFTRDSAKATDWPAVPEEWHAFPGHYRSHNPWTTSVRVVLNLGRLWLILSGGADGLDDQQPLVPLADSWFRCGDDERIPERIRFGAVVNGKALRANLSGCDFYRVNTP
jgi:CubicO group peptidase (beta-lactamase class C family)